MYRSPLFVLDIPVILKKEVKHFIVIGYWQVVEILRLQQMVQWT